jgi:hypothetical protein
MKFLLLLSLYFLVGCATKYVVPGNRFLTPESQGGAFRGQMEMLFTNANQLTVNTSNGSVNDGVNYSEISRTGFLLSNSLFDQFDFFWSHIGSANSMLGGKLQVIGDSRSARGAGNKLSLAAAVGGNEHETDDKSVEFELGGSEFFILYGYRINESFLPYTSVSYATYNFSGQVRSSNPVLNGLRPEIETSITSFNGGLELSMDAFFAKIEATYQELRTANTKDKSGFIFGYSLGFSW